MSRLTSSDGVSTKMKSPGNTHCLLIGAAENPQKIGTNVDGDKVHYFDEDLKPVFNSIRSDLAKMANFCGQWVKDVPQLGQMKQSRGSPKPKWKSPILVSLVLSDDGLQPSKENSALTPGAQKLMETAPVTTFKSKDEVREEIKNLIGRKTPDDNIIIFFAGHGSQHVVVRLDSEEAVVTSTVEPDYTQASPIAPTVQELSVPTSTIEHSFQLPCVNVFGKRVMDKYTDTELTTDVTHNLTGDKKVYLVLHSCHSAGMLHGWQLTLPQKQLLKDLSVAVFASANAEHTTQWTSLDGSNDFVSIFTQYATPGRSLVDIQADIFRASVSADANATPQLITLRPEQSKEHFLVSALPVSHQAAHVYH
ncbi:uncharacterized protein LOC135808570 [Sycon ciliatum]|uniref:uncharacterized protein LOC135808570 n=1 Tax=Sycon ciliatum TaxID=27933 RepID=UPI0031F6CC02|eukprot:scpid72142/ scgid35434/ 